MMTALIATALTSSAPASAAEARWAACIDRTTTNHEWAECGGRYIKEADAALNAEWARATAGATAKTKADLLTEQRAWLAYRKVACNFMANGDWGREGQVLHYQNCVAHLIEQRTADLAGYRTWRTRPEGN